MNQPATGESVTDGPADELTDEATEGPTDEGATLPRQAHRVLMASFYGTEIPAWLSTGLAAGIGSICLFGTNLTGDDEQVRQLAAALHRASPDGTLVTLDEEGGDVTRLDALRGSPNAGAAVLGAAADPGLTRQVAARIGRRLRDVGIDLDLGPVADVNCEPDNPVIGVRSFGADPTEVARHVEAFVGGLQEAGTAACVKHFPGHGATVDDSHLAVPRLDIDLATLRARELVPFAAAVRAGTAAVMTSHIVITALDAERPATTSPPVLELLRRELGFEGLLVTDALDMVGVARPYGGIPNAAVAALAAGADLLCLGPDHYPGEQEKLLPDVVDAILSAVREGRLDRARLAEAAARVDALVNTLAADGRAAPLTPSATAPLNPGDAAPLTPSDAAPLNPGDHARFPGGQRGTMQDHDQGLGGAPLTSDNAAPLNPDNASPLNPGDAAPLNPRDHARFPGGQRGTMQDHDQGLGVTDPSLEAARRALHLEVGAGGLPPLAGAVVVEFHVQPGIAAGPVPWGLAEPLTRLLPGIEARHADPDLSGSVEGHLRAAGSNRPLVAVVRDAHRHGWVARQLAELALGRPDLVTVETGWPVVDAAGTPSGLPGATRLWTYGGSAISLRAAAELLAAPGTMGSTTMNGHERR